jgi:sterol desaturase/sphingolipid hydroxylase (fatty acid hydroxylase superfamily)
VVFDQLSSLLNILWEPLTFFGNEGMRIYWPYLLSGFAIAVTVGYRRLGSVKAAVRDGLALQHWWSASTLVDLQWIILNHVLRVLVVVPLIGGQLGLAMLVNGWLYSAFGAGNYLAWGVLETSVLLTITIFLLDDCTRFFVHYLYHKVPLLWRFHAVHHSAAVLTPLTLYRIHFIEMFINSCRSLLVIGSVSGVFIYVFDGSVSLVEVLGVSVFTMLFNLAGANLRHSHVWLGFGRAERWFVSPAQHQIHHSIKSAHLDSNFGASLAIWDICLGTWISSRGESVEDIGLPGERGGQHFFRHITGV